MTETTLWLLPLLAGAILGLVNAARVGWRWSWGTMLQLSLVFVIALVGILLKKTEWLLSFSPTAYLHLSASFVLAIVDWIFLLSFTVFARILMTSMTQSLGLLRTDKAVRSARLLRILLWGPPGEFWLDLICMVDAYAKGNLERANQVYQTWSNKSLPQAIALSLEAYAMLGLLVNKDWDGVIGHYERSKERFAQEEISGKKKRKFPGQLAVSAVRAYNELGRYAEGSDALVRADLPSAGYGRESIDTIFLSYFAMIGDKDSVDRIVANMARSRNGSLPEFARLYWQGRCEALRGQWAQAVELFEKSVQKTPASDNIWRERSQRQLELARQSLQEIACVPSAEPDRSSDIHSSKVAILESCSLRAKEIFFRSTIVTDVMAGKKNAKTVNALVMIICAVFSVTYLPRLSNNESMYDVYLYTYAYGVLRDSVFHGEVWRLVTYQFLHGGISHLVMNVVGLVWFGRYVENIYGSMRFLLIFLLSGVLSGILQIVLTPDLPIVGASGAVLGIFGAGAAATIRLKNILPSSVRKSELTWMAVMAITQIVFDQIVNLLFPAAAEGGSDAVRIAAYAHIGGMLSGFALGWIMPFRNFLSSGVVQMRSARFPEIVIAPNTGT